jgi:phosphoribosylanthranilate isomerase
MKVKICGIMRAEDAESAIENGADALGYVVASPSSPRNLSLTRAKSLMRLTPIFTTKVAVTTAEDPKTVLRLCSKLKPEALQLHRHTKNLIETIRRKHDGVQLIIATPVHDAASLKPAKIASAYSDAVLADTPNLHSVGGGTGMTHDWHLTSMIRKEIHPHLLILAGGLNPKNVKVAISRVRPYAVDVSSGVEKRVGVKDKEKIREFIMNAKGTES